MSTLHVVLEDALVEATVDDRPELLLKKTYREDSPVMPITTDRDKPTQLGVLKEVLVSGAVGVSGGRHKIVGAGMGMA